MTQEGFRRRFVALAVVVTLHCLILLMPWVREPIERRITHEDQSSVLFFVETPRPTVTTAPSIEPRNTQSTPRIIAPPGFAEETSSAPAQTAPSEPVDWAAQAAQSAAAVVDNAIREEPRKCDPSESPSSFLPPCKPRTKRFEWNPEPRRVGFAGGLPYVRVGERCVVGLGFFGCGFGDPPPANGKLFEGMGDPERDRSSVPSPNP